jgi:hypothetical protein
MTLSLCFGVVDLRGVPTRLLYSEDPSQALDGEYARVLGEAQRRGWGWQSSGAPNAMVVVARLEVADGRS